MNQPFEKSSNLVYPHGFSTRHGGVSKGIFSSLNLGMNRGDEPTDVTKNWEIFLNSTGIGYKPFVCGKQVHENHVHIAKLQDARLAYGVGELIEADGYVTNVPHLPIAIFTADCVPVLMEDCVNHIVGAIHCGWRSTVADIISNSIDAFSSLGSSPDNIHIAIGPAIDRCCFEVGSEVIEGCTTLLGYDCHEFYSLKENGKYMLSLRDVVKKRYIQLGVNADNIDFVGACTMCHPNDYYSHRASNNIRGSLASAISIE